MRADARAAVLLAGTQTMLAGECPPAALGRLEDGAPAPRDRHADDARGTVLRSRHSDNARGGVPPLQRPNK